MKKIDSINTSRRHWVAAAGAAALTACSAQDCNAPAGGSNAASDEPVRRWKMVTTWPRNFPGLGTGAVDLAEAISAMSGGRIEVQVFSAGELVPAFETFDTVSSGTAQIGHGGSYYWKGKARAAQFFASVPFGLSATEMNAWLYHGGGLDLWQRLYEPFGLVPFAAGNSGMQMGGWFNKPIDSMADLKGLKMRIPGLGGEVLSRAGGVPVSLPGGEIFSSLQSGAIDATEFVGPYNDRAFGLNQAAQYYYYPGWHEPGTTLEAIVNKAAFDELPVDLQAIVRAACHQVNDRMLAEFTFHNARALASLKAEGVEIRRFPETVLANLRDISDSVVAEAAGQDSLGQEILNSYREFRDSVAPWTAMSSIDLLRV